MDNKNKRPLRAVIFTGGECTPEKISAEDLSGDLYIAADSGQNTARRCGIQVHLLVGDFDSSAAPDAPQGTQIVRVPAEKDDTDTMLACRMAVENGASDITVIGGTGGRIDHTLSNLFLLESLKAQGITARLTDGCNRIRVLSDEECTITKGEFHYFSLLATEDASVSVSGCRYPLDNAPLRRTLPYAVSNEITDKCAHISVQGGPVFLIESTDAQ